MASFGVFWVVILTFLGTFFATLDNLTGTIVSWGLVITIIVLSA